MCSPIDCGEVTRTTCKPGETMKSGLTETQAPLHNWRETRQKGSVCAFFVPHHGLIACTYGPVAHFPWLAMVPGHRRLGDGATAPFRPDRRSRRWPTRRSLDAPRLGPDAHTAGGHVRPGSRCSRRPEGYRAADTSVGQGSMPTGGIEMSVASRAKVVERRSSGRRRPGRGDNRCGRVSTRDQLPRIC